MFTKRTHCCVLLADLLTGVQDQVEVLCRVGRADEIGREPAGEDGELLLGTGVVAGPQLCNSVDRGCECAGRRQRWQLAVCSAALALGAGAGAGRWLTSPSFSGVIGSTFTVAPTKFSTKRCLQKGA